MNRRRTIERVYAVAVLLIALLLLGLGAARSHKVYDATTEEFGILAFTRIADRQLVEDATFSGVLRKGGRLYSQYDRAAPHGKRSCPT